MKRTWRRSVLNLSVQSTEEDNSSNRNASNSGMLVNMRSVLSRSFSNIAGYVTWWRSSAATAFENTNDSCMQSIKFTFKESQSQIVKNSQYIRNLKEGNATIDVEFDDSKTSMTISYPEKMRVQLKKDVQNLLKGLCTIPLKLEDGKTNLLERDPVIVYIEDELERQEINCQIVPDHQNVTVIIAENKIIGKEGEQVIKSCLVEREFKKSNIAKNRLDALIEALNKKHGKKILIRSCDESLMVYCTSDIEKDVSSEIEQEQKPKYVSQEVTIDLQKYKYMDTFQKEELHGVASSFDVKLEFAVQIGSECGKMILSGDRCDVFRMNARLRKAIDAIHTDAFVVTDTVCCDFLRDNASDVCKELGRKANCIVDVKLMDDCNERLEARIAGKTFKLKLTQHTSAQTVVQMIRSNGSTETTRNRILPDILQKAKDNGNLVELKVPFRRGRLQKKTFEDNITRLLKDVELDSTSSMAIMLESGFNKTDEIIFKELLTSFQHFFGGQKSSLQKISFHFENDDYKLHELQKIITGIAKLEQNQLSDCSDKYVVKFAGRKNKLQGINVLHEIQNLNLKMNQHIRMQTFIDQDKDIPSRMASQSSDIHQGECDSDSGVYLLKSQNDRTWCVDSAETVLSSSSQSIGMVHIDLPNNEEINGTCFRVGDKYIMTTLHTLTPKFDQLKHNTTVLTRVRQWKQKVFDKDVFVIFGYKKISHRDRLYKHRLQCRAAYINHDLDVAIMELKTDKGPKLPKPLLLARQCYIPLKITFIYHSKGDVQILDPECKIIKVNDPSIGDAKIYASTNYPGYGDGYKDISSENFFLCHSSAQSGASGAPGMIVDSSYKEQCVVFCFMSEGFPSFYPTLSPDEQSSYPHDLMFEKAIRMDAVYAALKRDDKDLCEELFPVIPHHESMDC